MFNETLITENRRASALKKDLTPLKIDRSVGAAFFAGSGGKIYETNLDSCSCPDFAIQGFEQPCKHMIRLAMEMNAIPADGIQTDIEAARGKYFAGKAKEFIKYADPDAFIPFAIYFCRLAFYEKPVPDNAFANSLDAETVAEIPFFKLKKDGTASVRKEWKKECENISTALFARFGREMMDYANFDNSFMEKICKEGE